MASSAAARCELVESHATHVIAPATTSVSSRTATSGAAEADDDGRGLLAMLPSRNGAHAFVHETDGYPTMRNVSITCARPDEHRTLSGLHLDAAARYLVYVRRSAKCSFAGASGVGQGHRAQELQHFDIVRVRCEIVFGLGFLAVRRFENQWDARRSAVGQEPAERLDPDLALPQQCVAISIRSGRPL